MRSRGCGAWRSLRCKVMAFLPADNSEANDQDAIEHFGWIPREMLNATWRKDVTVELKWVPLSRAELTRQVSSQRRVQEHHSSSPRKAR